MSVSILLEYKKINSNFKNSVGIQKIYTLKDNKQELK